MIDKDSQHQSKVFVEHSIVLNISKILNFQTRNTVTNYEVQYFI